MDRPISVIITEAKQNIVDCINSQNLNITILDMVMKDIYLEIHGLADQTYQKEKAEYESQNIGEDKPEEDKQSELHGDSLNDNSK